jgi:hypothetical protein
MSGIQLGDHQDTLLTRKEASSELLRMGIRRSPSTLAKIFCLREDGPPCTHLGRTPYYPKRQLHEWVRSRLTALRSSSQQPRHQGDWSRPPNPQPAFTKTDPARESDRDSPQNGQEPATGR